MMEIMTMVVVAKMAVEVKVMVWGVLVMVTMVVVMRWL